MKMNSPPDSGRAPSPGGAVADVDGLELDVAVDGGDLGLELSRDVRLRRDLIHEVLGHALLERVAAADDGHGARVIGEEERSLAGRVAGADDVDIEPVRARRLAPRRAVEDALADQRLEAGIARCLHVTPVARMIVRAAQLVAAVETERARRPGRGR